MTSQKTLSVATLIIPQLAKATSSSALRQSTMGYALLVCVFVYILQLAMDFMIGNAWSQQILES